MKKCMATILAISLLLVAFPFGAITVSADQDGYYTYTIRNNTATITAVSTFIEGDVVIPSELGGYPVTTISSYAFDRCYYVQSVVVPEGVAMIDSGAFNECHLKTIVLPSTLTTLGSYAFKSSSLQEITIPEGITRIEGSTFSYCKSLKLVSLPDGITYIGPDAFREAKVQHLIFPKSVEQVGYSAFYNGIIQNVWYLGTAEEANEMALGLGNDNLLSAQWHYNTCEEAQHIYANACAKECSSCEWVRDVSNEHTYDGICDPDCNICAEVRDVPEHFYSNDCDRDCNNCNAVRVAPHCYENVCDDTCDVCGNVRTVEPHTYANVCDIDCNKCGSVRVAPHTYSNSCDSDCDICGFSRGSRHKYDHLYDTDCSVCGDIRKVEAPITFGGNATHETVSGLAFRFDVDVMGMQKDNFVAIYDNATIHGYKLLNMGAIVTNGFETKDIPAVYLCGLKEATASFTVRIIGIPAFAYDIDVTATPYIILEIDGVATTIYGEAQTCSYNDAMN